MTEIDWRRCFEAEKLVALVAGRVSERQLRLMACGITRQYWDCLTDERSRAAVETAEAYADGLATWEQLRSVEPGAEQASLAMDERFSQALRLTRGKLRKHVKDMLPAVAAARMARSVAATYVRGFFSDQDAEVECGGGAEWDSRAAHLPPQTFNQYVRQQAAIVRDVVGNPFRPTSIDPAWLTWNEGTIARLARSICEARDFSSMPILADALEDAGCTDRELLDHCRETALHVRGCHVLDLLLGKEQPRQPHSYQTIREQRPAIYWTILQAAEVVGSYVRQTSCVNHFARVTLRFEPYEGSEAILFASEVDLDKVDDYYYRLTFPGYLANILQGIEDGLAQQSQAGKEIAGIRITLSALQRHSGDSRDGDFRLAATSALSEALREGTLVQVGP